MKASSESGEWASLISTVCSPGFSVAVCADIGSRFLLPRRATAERDASLRERARTRRKGDAGNLRGAVPGRFLCRKKVSTGTTEWASEGKTALRHARKMEGSKCEDELLIFERRDVRAGRDRG